jgi:hypothetical protein
MEAVMHARLVLVAAGALALATSGAAQPAKTPAAQPNPSTNHAAPVVLASADHVTTPASTSDAPPVPAKPHRAARVTTCRCGGDPQTEQPEEQQ